VPKTTNYSLFKKEQFNTAEALRTRGTWDVLISAYNQEERVHEVYRSVVAHRKIWALLPDYELSIQRLPAEVEVLSGDDEAAIVENLLVRARVKEGDRVCIDSTGVLRQYLVVLVRALQLRGITTFDVLYSEPSRYGEKESTEFSGSELVDVRQVHGFEGSHSTETSRDLLVIGAGYEHRLVGAVSDEKNHASKRLIYAFPSFRADMYQESALAMYSAYESVGRGAQLGPHFAPAYDPFVAAETIRQVHHEVAKQQGSISNLYLAPLSTKPIAIGFALYYIFECVGTSASIIHPFMRSYANRAAYGISRIWLYRLELPAA